MEMQDVQEFDVEDYLCVLFCFVLIDTYEMISLNVLKKVFPSPVEENPGRSGTFLSHMSFDAV